MMLAWIRERFHGIAANPDTWGSQEAVECALLLLIEAELVALEKDVDCLYEGYGQLKHERFPMIGSAVCVADAVGRMKDANGYLSSTPEGRRAVAAFCVDLRARLGLS
jgi:hypothetical protein